MIDGESGLEPVGGERAIRQHDPGVVDEHVDVPRTRQDLGGSPAYRGETCEVEHHQGRLAPRLFRDRFDRGTAAARIPCGDRHVCAHAGEGDGGGESDTGARPGYDDGLACHRAIRHPSAAGAHLPASRVTRSPMTSHDELSNEK